MRRVFAAVLALSVIAGCRHGAAPAGGSPKTKPKLVVLVVIDQWPSWIFEKQRGLYKRGLKRLLDEGAVVPEADIPYAPTFTAPGHASLATGTTPGVHGIVGNSWVRRSDAEKERVAEWDADAPMFSVGPALGAAEPLTAEMNASGKALHVDGVADALRAATGGEGHSISIALKARSACLVAGKKPDLAVWYDESAGGMTTSKAYAAEVPAWLTKLAHDVPPSRFFDSTWDARDPALLAKATGIADDSPGESSGHGLGAAFPHALAKSDHPEEAIVETPFADTLVMRTVAVALDELHLGDDETPDFLAISFSAHDYAGHSWGPDSWEVLDMTLRLDAQLGELFESLDARVGLNNWAVIVTSDHGATPLIERARIRSARRITSDEIAKAADRGVAQLLGGGPWVEKVVSNNVYMTPKFIALSESQKNDAYDAATKGIAGVPGIAYAGRTDRFSDGCTAEKDVYKAICLGYVKGEGGELYAFPTVGSVITDYAAGTGHDAPSDDNRKVPILIKAPGIPAQEGTGSMLQVAPTLAALLGIDPPAAAKSPTLFKIQRR